MAQDSAQRFRRALDGETVEPCVTGLSFVSPELLSPASGVEEPARLLARTCAEAGLDFAFVPSWEPWAPDGVRELVLAGIAALWVVPGVLWPALEQTGVEEGLRATAADPDSLAPALDAAAAASRSAVRAGLALGASAIVIAEDLAGAGGPIVSPDFAGDEVFPRFALLVDAAAHAGVPAVLHCDGDARVLYPAARRAGFAAVHGDLGGSARFEKAASAARLAAIGLVGGIETADLTDAASAALAGTRAGVFAAAGGFLVADDGGISTREQATALIEALAAARR